MAADWTAGGRFVWAIGYAAAVGLKFVLLLLCALLVDPLTADSTPKVELKGRRALLVGAGGEFGRRLAKRLARRGVSLILWDGAAARLEATVEFLQQRGVNRVRSRVLDGRAAAGATEAARRTVGDFGPVDFLLFNLLDEPHALEPAASIFNIGRAFLPLMAARREGHVLLLTSLAGLFGCPTRPLQSAAAHAAVGAARSLEAALHGRPSLRSTLLCCSPLAEEEGENDSWLFPALPADRVADGVLAAMENAPPLAVLPARAHFAHFCWTALPSRPAALIAAAFHQTTRSGRSGDERPEREWFASVEKPLEEIDEPACSC